MRAAVLKALVIDTDFRSRAFVREALSALCDVEVRECGDGPPGLEVLKSWDPHLVVVDYRMRPITGLEVVRRIRAGARTAHSSVPIVLMTEFADIEHVRFARSGGADVVLLRPFGADTLLRGVAKALARPVEGSDQSEGPRAFVAPDGLRL
jgi:two-component system chemotaxis response regulator CheY